MAKRSAQFRAGILARLQRDSVVSVSGLARTLGCSEMTVRRHLGRLETEGLLERQRGGAVASRRVRLEFDLFEKSQSHRAQKAAIGRAAAGLVRPGERVILDTGTTTLAMARELGTRDFGTAQAVSVVTTSLAIISELMHARQIECILLGGTVRENSPDLYGPLVEDNLSRIHADRAFIGCDGISARGQLMTTDPRVARITGLMIEQAERVVLLADSSKAGRNSFISFGRLEQLDTLITDQAMPDDILTVARDAGVETILVSISE